MGIVPLNKQIKVLYQDLGSLPLSRENKWQTSEISFHFCWLQHFYKQIGSYKIDLTPELNQLRELKSLLLLQTYDCKQGVNTHEYSLNM